ncbi:MAG: hypothetical protein HYT76_04115 [Deltaproteobacteria bacterium]|nr:hypothetical protein [Deltaproteobacteria bacterium]MBI2981952.1 hypothetical protein [Deltaproteobacteria bacterium]
MPILKLEKDDPQKELEFEVKCALEQTPEQRLERWYEWNINLLKFAQERRKALFGPEETPKIVKRP